MSEETVEFDAEQAERIGRVVQAFEAGRLDQAPQPRPQPTLGPQWTIFGVAGIDGIPGATGVLPDRTPGTGTLNRINIDADTEDLEDPVLQVEVRNIADAPVPPFTWVAATRDPRSGEWVVIGQPAFSGCCITMRVELTETTLEWNGIDGIIDHGGYFEGLLPNRVTIPEDGLYEVAYDFEVTSAAKTTVFTTVSLAAGGFGVPVSIALFADQTTTDVQSAFTSTRAARVSATRWLELGEDDYLEIAMFAFPPDPAIQQAWGTFRVRRLDGGTAIPSISGGFSGVI